MRDLRLRLGNRRSKVRDIPTRPIRCVDFYGLLHPGALLDELAVSAVPVFLLSDLVHSELVRSAMCILWISQVGG
jgi:hypothetical protein